MAFFALPGPMQLSFFAACECFGLRLSAEYVNTFEFDLEASYLYVESKVLFVSCEIPHLTFAGGIPENSRRTAINFAKGLSRPEQNFFFS
jgi:hypothetical protein